MNSRLIFLSLLVAKISFGQASLSIKYGSDFDAGSSTLTIFSNEAKVGFDSTNIGLMISGYFNSGFDEVAQASTVKDVTSLTSYLNNFNHFKTFGWDNAAEPNPPNTWEASTVNFANAGGPGWMSGGGTVYSDSSEGKIPYTLLLAGIDDWTNLSQTTEVGLFSNNTDLIPAGAEPTPADYDYTSLTYNEILIGDDQLGFAFTDPHPLKGFTGNIYSTKAIPEPSTYALFLGVFSLGFVVWRKRVVKNNAKK
jgi:hypothetical protein